MGCRVPLLGKPGYCVPLPLGIGPVGLALVIALNGASSVFDLVILAWSTLAVAFGPLLLLQALNWRPGQAAAIAMTLAGVAVALAWRQAGLHDMIYEGLPGILVGLGLGLALSKRGPSPKPAAARAS